MLSIVSTATLTLRGFTYRINGGNPNPTGKIGIDHIEFVAGWCRTAITVKKLGGRQADLRCAYS